MRGVFIIFLSIAIAVCVSGQSPLTESIAVIDSNAFGQRGGIRRVIQAQDVALGGFAPYKHPVGTLEHQTEVRENYKRRLNSLRLLMEPVDGELEEALRQFQQVRNIVLLVDMAKYPDLILVARPEIDITREFIDYFNGPVGKPRHRPGS